MCIEHQQRSGIELVKIGPVGKLIEGHVLDVSKTALTRALRDYDKQLYIKWNPKKLRGWGCWEVRRKPEKKTALYHSTHEGVDYYSLEYYELGIISHIMDAAFLNYDLLRKLKEMDTWQVKDWVSELEYRERQYFINKHEKDLKDTKYNLLQERSMIRDFRAAILSGTNPANLARYWGKEGQ